MGAPAGPPRRLDARGALIASVGIAGIEALLGVLAAGFLWFLSRSHLDL